MARPPTISICLPNYNTRPFLEERMETILSQTYQDWELVVCDSYSTDGSWELFQRYSHHPKIRLFQVPRLGVYAGCNECLSRAQGKYMYIATSDDTASSNLLERLHDSLERSPHLSIAMCDYQPIDMTGSPLESKYNKSLKSIYGDWLNIPSIRNGKTEFLLMASLGCPTWTTMTSVLFRRHLLEKTGLFPTNRGSAGDFEWAMRAVLASDLLYVPGRLATWRIHPAQATPQEHNAKFVRAILCCILSIIRDPIAGIPMSWTKIRGWDNILTDYWRHQHDDYFGLYRYIARQDPRLFFLNCMRATCSNPMLLLRQMLCCFSCSRSCPFHPVDNALKLMQTFDSRWPPTEISS